MADEDQKDKDARKTADENFEHNNQRFITIGFVTASIIILFFVVWKILSYTPSSAGAASTTNSFNGNVRQVSGPAPLPITVPPHGMWSTKIHIPAWMRISLDQGSSGKAGVMMRLTLLNGRTEETPFMFGTNLNLAFTDIEFSSLEDTSFVINYKFVQ